MERKKVIIIQLVIEEHTWHLNQGDINLWLNFNVMIENSALERNADVS